MKTLLYILLGIALGIICINCVVSAVTSLLHLSVSSCVVSALMAFLFGFIAKKCFAKI